MGYDALIALYLLSQKVVIRFSLEEMIETCMVGFQDIVCAS